jgi:hypothetical protein
MAGTLSGESNDNSVMHGLENVDSARGFSLRRLVLLIHFDELEYHIDWDGNAVGKSPATCSTRVVVGELLATVKADPARQAGPPCSNVSSKTRLHPRPPERKKRAPHQIVSAAQDSKG